MSKDFQELLNQLEEMKTLRRSSSIYTYAQEQEQVPQEAEEAKTETPKVEENIIAAYGADLGKLIIGVFGAGLAANAAWLLGKKTIGGILSVSKFLLRLMKVETYWKFMKVVLEIVKKGGPSALSQIQGLAGRVIALKTGAAAYPFAVGLAKVAAAFGVGYTIGMAINWGLDQTGISKWLDEKIWNAFGDDEETKRLSTPYAVRIISLYKGNAKPIPSAEEMKEHTKEYLSFYKNLMPQARTLFPSTRGHALQLAMREKALEEFAKSKGLSYIPPKTKSPEKPKEPKQEAPKQETAPPTAPKPTSQVQVPKVYTVQAGDTLSGIAQRFLGDMNRWKEIQDLNPEITDPNKIVVNQEIKLPSAADMKAPKPKQTTKPDVKKTPKPAPMPQKGMPPAKQQEVQKTPEKVSKGKQFVDNFKTNVNDLITQVQLGDYTGEQGEQLAQGVRQVAQTGNIKAYLQALNHLGKKSTRDVDVLNYVETASPGGLKNLFLKDLATNYMKKKDFKESDWQDLASLERYFGFEGGMPRTKRAKEYADSLLTLRKFVHRKSQER